MIHSKLLSQHHGINHVFLGRIPDGQSHKHAAYLTGVASAEQVHDAAVAVVSRFSKRYDGVDGLVSAEGGGSLQIRTADCLPVLLFDPSRNVIAAVHAGWKGLYGNIIAEAIATLNRLGGAAENSIAVIGPHIGNCCYSVATERIEQFVEKGYNRKQIARQSGSASYLNLSLIARQQLQQAGIDARRIETVDVCTYCDERFYSYRRDGKDTGRNYSVIALH